MRLNDSLVTAALICAAGFSQARDEAGVYAPLLSYSYHGVHGSLMVVEDTTVAMRSLQGSSSEWLKQFDNVPLALRQLANRPSPTQRHPLDTSSLPSQTRLVSASTVSTIFAGSGTEDHWSAFRTQTKAQGWLAFSDALLTDGALNALVYYEARCGGTCGEGGYVWLRRDSVGSPWRIAKKIVSWNS